MLTPSPRTSIQNPSVLAKVVLGVVVAVSLSVAILAIASPAIETAANVSNPVIAHEAGLKSSAPISLNSDESFTTHQNEAGVDTSQPNEALRSVTQNGVTISITWVYADLERIGIEYLIGGVKFPEGYQKFCPVRQVEVSDETSTRASTNSEFRCVANATGEFLISHSFDRTELNRQNQSVNVTLDILVGGITLIPKPTIGTATQPPVDLPDFGKFHFELTVPLTSGLTLKAGPTLTQHGVPATLRKLTVNPSVTQAEICFELPTNADWLPEATLTDGKQAVPGDCRLLNADDPATFVSNNRCYAYSFPVVYETKNPTKGFAITIEQLRTSMPETLDNARIADAIQRLQATNTGVEFTYQQLEHGFNLNILKKPIGMSDDQAYQLIQSALTE